MSANRAKNSKPELLLRKALWHSGLRGYRLHYKIKLSSCPRKRGGRDMVGAVLDIRSQGYGDDNEWDGLTEDDLLEGPDTAFVWSKWEPMELW